MEQNITLSECTNERDSSSSDLESLNHSELLEITTNTLNTLLSRDELLKDLPRNITLEEVNSQIALQHGRSITIYVITEDRKRMAVVVPQKESKVIDLKRAISRHINLKLTREANPVKVNWRYVWKNNWLIHEGVTLQDDQALLTSHDISNNSQIFFRKQLRKKGKFKA